MVERKEKAPNALHTENPGPMRSTWFYRLLASPRTWWVVSPLLFLLAFVTCFHDIVTGRSLLLVRKAFLIGLSGTAFLAFTSARVQILALCGQDGVHTPSLSLLTSPTALRQSSPRKSVWTPAGWMQRLEDWFVRRAARYWGTAVTDERIATLPFMGQVASVALALGTIDITTENRADNVVLALLGGVLRVVSLLVVIFSYINIRKVSGFFFCFQWDVLLVECCFLSIPLALPPVPALIPLFLLPLKIESFRLVFQSGVDKVTTGCPRWNGLDAMAVHFETQCLPLPLSWYLHALPYWVQRISTVATLVLEIVFPVLLLMWPTPLRTTGVVSVFGLMGLIVVSGIYGFFNVLTCVLSITSLTDDVLAPLVGQEAHSAVAWHPALLSMLVLFAFALPLSALLSMATGLPLLRPMQLAVPYISEVTDMFSYFHVGKRYGLFTEMTSYRHEIVFEVSHDNETWEEVHMRYKPGDVDDRPAMSFFHFPRVDWALWFPPLGYDSYTPEWLNAFCVRLLEGSARAASLLKDPQKITAHPPKYVRISLWDYHFTSCSPSVHRCTECAFGANEIADASSSSSRRSPSIPQGNSPRTNTGRWWCRRFVRYIRLYTLTDGTPKWEKLE